MAPCLALAPAGCGEDAGSPAGDAATADGGSDAQTAPDGITTADAAPDAAADAAGDPAPALPHVNRCDETMFTATDRTATAAMRDIAFTGSAYTPKCMKVKMGQTVTWMGTFSMHPLDPSVSSFAPGSDPGTTPNPIPATMTGTSLPVTFTGVGTFPFLCLNHEHFGMFGAIKVVP